jgi:hypothetical protein
VKRPVPGQIIKIVAKEHDSSIASKTQVVIIFVQRYDVLMERDARLNMPVLIKSNDVILKAPKVCNTYTHMISLLRCPLTMPTGESL